MNRNARWRDSAVTTIILCQRVLLAACVALPLPALAGAPGQPRDWTLGLEAEWDGDGGAGYAADLGWWATPATLWFLGASYVEAGNDENRLSTRSLDAGGYYDFGPAGIEVAVGTWQDPDLIDTQTLRAALDFPLGAWSVTLRGEVRESEFEPFRTGAAVTLRDGRQLPVLANADCDLDNTGFGINVAFTGQRFSGYLDGASYQYSDLSCRFDSALLTALEDTRPQLFREFAGRLTQPLSTSALTRIGAENALLDWSWGGGLRLEAGRLAYSVDFSHQADYLEDLSVDTASAAIDVEINAALSLRISAGLSWSDVLETVAFGGLGVALAF